MDAVGNWLGEATLGPGWEQLRPTWWHSLRFSGNGLVGDGLGGGILLMRPGPSGC